MEGTYTEILHADLDTISAGLDTKCGHLIQLLLEGTHHHHKCVMSLKLFLLAGDKYFIIPLFYSFKMINLDHLFAPMQGLIANESHLSLFT